MMRSTISNKMLLTFLLWFVFTSGWAASVDTSVIVEIDTIDMGEEAVENVISEPIEVLLGSLDDVFMVSAKYLPNKAIINVKFSETSTDPANADTLVARVKALVNSYMDKLPSSIDSISVSLGDSPEPVIVSESASTNDEQASDRPTKKQKNNRNNSVPKSEAAISSFDNSSSVLDKPGVIRSVEKRSMSGRYLGSIQSSNEYLPIITTLVPAGAVSGDVAVGKYFMSEQDEIVNGEITECYNNTGNILTCQWRDKYGTGGVDFIFTPDYASFSGRWSINGKEGAYKWSGHKVKDIN